MYFNTERLLLRDIVIEDYLEFSKYTTLEMYYRYLSTPNPSVESTKAYVEKMVAFNNAEPRDYYIFTMIEKSSDKIIGHIKIRIEDRASRCAVVGYTMNPDYWGKGFMSEAFTFMLGFGFEELGLKRIYGVTDPLNLGSVKVMKKCGLQYEGLHRSEEIIRGNYRDSVYYAILDDDWKKLHDN